MADWDFESALKDYFGASTEDGDASLGAGSATFSAPSGWDFAKVSNDYLGFRAPRYEPTQGGGGNGWDFDKALNDYFGGVNGYIAPRGYESPDVRTQRNTPWEFSPPSEPPPPSSDYDQAVWFNALQRRHEAWDQAQEQQELLRAPRGYIAPRGYEFPDLGGIGAREDFGLRHPGLVPPLPPGTPTGEWTQPNEWGVSYPVVTPGTRPEGIINRWLGNFLPTPQEEELSRNLPWWGIGSIPYGARVLGNLLAPVGAAHEWTRQNVPGVGGAENLAGNVLRYSQVYPLFGAAIMEAKAQGPAQQAYDEYVKTLNQYLPATPEQQARLDELNTAAYQERQAGVRKQIEEMGLNPDRWQDRLEAGHRAYKENVPEAVRIGLSFIDPGYWALGLAGRGIASRGKALAAKAAGEGGLAERIRPMLSGIKPRQVPGTGAPGALEEAAAASRAGAPLSTRMEKLTELELLRNDLMEIKPTEYSTQWPKTLSNGVGRKVQRPADLTDEELNRALEVFRARAEGISSTKVHELIKLLPTNAAPFRKLTLTRENWLAEFGENQTVKTPIGEVQLREDQYDKLILRGRAYAFGLIKPTLEDPVLIVRDAEEGTLFIKSFVTSSKQKIFVSVAQDEDGLELVVSNGERELKKIIGKVKQGQLLYSK